MTQPATYARVRDAILHSIDVANLEMEFSRIVHRLGQLPPADRETLLAELEDITAGRATGRRNA
jgi:hypothetical protein